MSSSSTYLDPVVIPLLVGGSVLDVGCGYGRWGALIRSNFWEAGLAAPPVVDGIDAFAPNVELCAASTAYRRVWQQELPGPLDGAWDVVLACEVVEHIAQELVGDFLASLELAARRRIILTTPNFPVFREGVDTVAGHNRFDAHLSYVDRGFLRSRGYRLLGAGWGNPRSRLVRAASSLRLAPSLHSTVRRLPSLAETIVAVKDIA